MPQNSLKDQLNWIDIKLQHAVRANTLREVYQKNQETPFEELRAKLQHKRIFTNVFVEQDNRGI